MRMVIMKKEGSGMKITILGAGAMGALFGGYLSRNNDVTLIDLYGALVDKINQDGVLIQEPDGGTNRLYPKASVNADGMEPQDLVIIFVKAMFSHAALETNRGLIGKNTYLMTLQNGSGHEDTLLDFVDEDHVIIGTTQHNSAVGELGTVRHGGSGMTHIGCIAGDVSRLQCIAENFTACGLKADCDSNVQKLIWEKMFTNVSASALTGVLQVPLGYIVENSNAWNMCQTLIREAVAVAAGLGLAFDADEKIAEVRKVCENSPQGITSICADLMKGRRSEVDTISGSIVRAGRKCGVPAPSHALMVDMIHAMEARKNNP